YFRSIDFCKSRPTPVTHALSLHDALPIWSAVLTKSRMSSKDSITSVMVTPVTYPGGNMSGYKATHLDDIAAEQWPYWAPIRHHFDIGAFGINAWRGTDGDEVIKRHTESESGQEELFLVLSGRCTFT